MEEDPHKDSDEGQKMSHENGAARNGSGVMNGEKRPSYDAETGEYKKRDLHGDPFGDETDAEVKYRTMTWWQAAVTMIAETISLGILSLPSVLAAIGLVGGLIVLIGLGIIATYTGYVIGQFKLAYPHVHNMADAGEVLFTPVGPRAAAIARECFGGAQIIFLIFIMGSHILTWIIALNTMSDHVTCSIVWGVVGMIVLFIFTLPRTLKKVSYLSIACEYRSSWKAYNRLIDESSLHIHLQRRTDNNDRHRHRTAKSGRASHHIRLLRRRLLERHEHHLRLCRSRSLLLLHQRTERSKRLPQGPLHAPGMGHLHVRRCLNSHLPLRWSGHRLTCTWNHRAGG